MVKNWLRSAMTISSGLGYKQAGVHSHKCLEMEPAKNN
jgi:hypothetical protein